MTGVARNGSHSSCAASEPFRRPSVRSACCEALTAVLDGPHVPLPTRTTGGTWLWTCSCTPDWLRRVGDWAGVEREFGWHLLAVERLRGAPCS